MSRDKQRLVNEDSSSGLLGLDEVLLLTYDKCRWELLLMHMLDTTKKMHISMSVQAPADKQSSVD